MTRSLGPGSAQRRKLFVSSGLVAVAALFSVSLAFACVPGHGHQTVGISPTSGPVGGTTQVTGAQWYSGTPITLSWGQDGFAIGQPVTAYASASGELASSIQIPASARRATLHLTVAQDSPDGLKQSAAHYSVLTADRRLADFNGDGGSDASVYRNGTWFVKGMAEVQWGGDPTDKPVPGNYNSDPIGDFAVYRAGTGVWYIRNIRTASWGGDPTDVPVPADYDMDGDRDIAVYRKATGTWYLEAGAVAIQWGGDPTDVPVPADYDADGDIDQAVYRASTGMWYVRGIPSLESQWGGDPSDIPVVGDYDGDGDADFAVYRVSNGRWYVKGQPALEGQWGGDSSDKPVPGDFNRDGKNDIAVYRQATGMWYVRNQVEERYGGESSDVPLAKQPGL